MTEPERWKQRAEKYREKWERIRNAFVQAEDRLRSEKEQEKRRLKLQRDEIARLNAQVFDAVQIIEDFDPERAEEFRDVWRYRKVEADA